MVCQSGMDHGLALIDFSLLSDVAKGFARSLRVTGLNLSEYSEQQSEYPNYLRYDQTLTFRYYRTSLHLG